MKTKFIQLLTLAFVFVIQVALAQQTVTGTISNSNGEPIPGATVAIKGSSSATSADFDGRYSIIASNGDVLLVSYVGYLAAQYTLRYLRQQYKVHTWQVNWSSMNS